MRNGYAVSRTSRQGGFSRKGVLSCHFFHHKIEPDLTQRVSYGSNLSEKELEKKGGKMRLIKNTGSDRVIVELRKALVSQPS